LNHVYPELFLHDFLLLVEEAIPLPLSAPKTAKISGRGTLIALFQCPLTTTHTAG
jgi:hypothetical protein